MTRAIIAILVAALGTGAAQASSDAAWAAFDRKVTTRCAAASRLIRPRVSRVVGFDDTLGKVAALVSGTQAVKGRGGAASVPVRLLCVFDKRTGRTWLSEAEGWSAPVR